MSWNWDDVFIMVRGIIDGEVTDTIITNKGAVFTEDEADRYIKRGDFVKDFDRIIAIYYVSPRKAGALTFDKYELPD